MSVLLPPLRRLFSDEDVALLIALRRDLHRHPELSWKENRTSAKLADAVTALGAVDVRRVANTGVVARFAGRDRGAPVVAVRGDIDALPIEEATGLPFVSTSPGVMMLSGLRSRCRIPSPCAALSASAVCEMMSAARIGVRNVS